jgi:hypothetical protein
MKAVHVTPADLDWTCRGCGRALEARTVTVEYMGNRFTTDLPTCPRCGFVMISEEVALGKMAEVEQILEDK